MVDSNTETHPWEPFIPPGAKILIMGTFPPGKHRWSMDFYYPNKTNDFWFMMGLIFFDDKYELYDRTEGKFKLDEIKALLTEKGIALHDTCHVIRRLKGNASDKFLEIVQPTDIGALLERMPYCRAIATTGEKAAGVVAEYTSTSVPKMGEFVEWKEGFEIWRMPSTSRAFPLRLERKAEFYRRMFDKILG